MSSGWLKSAIACGPRLDGGGGVAPHGEDDAFGAGVHQVTGQHITRAVVVDAYQVEVGTVGIVLEVAVEQHDRDAGPLQHGDQLVVGFVAGRGELGGREEDARDALRDVLLAQGLGGLQLAVSLRDRRSPGERVRTRCRRAHDALADRLKDVGRAEVRDEHAELVRRRLPGFFDVGSRTRAAGDEVVALQGLKGFGDGDAGGFEAFAQDGLGGQPVAGPVYSGLDLREELLVDRTVTRHLGSGGIYSARSAIYRFAGGADGVDPWFLF